MQGEMQLRAKKKKLESEYADRKRGIDATLQHGKLEIDNELRASLSQADAEYRHELLAAAKDHSNRLEELEHQFQRQLRDHTPPPSTQSTRSVTPRPKKP
jgi:hypothetical protein